MTRNIPIKLPRHLFGFAKHNGQTLRHIDFRESDSQHVSKVISDIFHRRFDVVPDLVETSVATWLSRHHKRFGGFFQANNLLCSFGPVHSAGGVDKLPKSWRQISFRLRNTKLVQVRAQTRDRSSQPKKKGLDQFAGRRIGQRIGRGEIVFVACEKLLVDPPHDPRNFPAIVAIQGFIQKNR